MPNKVMRSTRLIKLVLELAEGLGSDAKAYREFEVPRSTFYRWKKAYSEQGDAGLIRKKPIAKSHLVMKGVDLPTVQKLMGHSDIKTTMIYAHLAPDHLAGAVDKLSF